MSTDPLRDDIGSAGSGGRRLTQKVPDPSEDGDERATITVRDDREPTRVEIGTPTRCWTFEIDQRTARLVDGDDVPDWMSHLLAHFGIEEVER